MKKLDLLIIAPSAARLYQELQKDFSAKEPNIWAGLLASAVKKYGFGVAIYDMEIERPTEAELASQIESHDPRLK